VSDNLTDEQTAAIWALRRARASRWRLASLRGYPALSIEDETEATLAAAPPPVEVRGKPRKEEGAEGV
jgi:hypothetical protein